ncbi:MAG: hypothetical protein R3C14_20655 [Caldilineaceae bacterium]
MTTAIQPLTTGPRFHWFGYYDKLQFDPTGRYALGMAVDFEHRPPRPEDLVQIGMVDLQDHNRWIELGESRAWGWQAGCMLQWLPGSAHEIIWNDRAEDRFVSHILDVESGRRRTLPHPIFTLSPDGHHALTIDFHRLEDMRPGYGYMGIPDPWAHLLAPAETGIHTVDLQTGARRLILSLAQVAALPYPHGEIQVAKHYFNVLIFNPSGTRFLFLHRWRFGDGPFHTRLLTAAADGADVRIVDHSGHTSHLIWRDDAHILAWSRRPSHGDAFYLFPDAPDGADDGSAPITVVGKEAMPLNGHCTYLPDREWILNDTYPQGAERLQALYLYHTPTGRRLDLGALHAPPAYTGPLRCDLHPRFSPDGRKVVIDSAHGGNGRQMYWLDLSAIV